MAEQGFHVVTGAFGYSGQYIARRLLAKGLAVRTLTNSPSRQSPLAGRVRAFPLCLDDPDRLVEALRGAAVLYNTYWVRFDGKGFSHEAAVEGTRRLFEAARRARVGRVVHVSITNPSESSDLPYFRGKAALERELRATGLSHAILRPTVLFGREDVLVNNIAWLLRTFPVFGLFGRGDYRLQPIFVDDLAALAVDAGAASEDLVVEAIGPETFPYRDLVALIGEAIGRPRPLVPMPPRLAWLAGKAVGLWKRDVTITWEEVLGLSRGLLAVDAPPAGSTPLSAWARENREVLGETYTSELARRRDRRTAYDLLDRGRSRPVTKALQPGT